MQTTAGSVTAWYHSDALGSVRVLSNSSAAILNTSSYSAYGTPTFTSGSTPNTHGYAGEQIDPTGLSYNRARYYDATLGRFTQRDTFAGRVQNPLSLNRHIYAKNSPTNATDPSGWCTDLLSCSVEVGSRVVSSLDEITGPAKIIWQAAPAAAATAAGATTTGGGATLTAGGVGLAAAAGVLLGTVGACGAKATFAPQAFCLWNGNQAFNQSNEGSSCGGAGGDFDNNEANPSTDDANDQQVVDNEEASQTLEEQSSEEQDKRVYKPSPKHQKGGWDTLMDLDDATAQGVLNDGIQEGKQIYGYKDGKAYEFQPDNAGTYHGYPVSGNEVPNKILREWRNNGTLSNREYRRQVKGKE